MALPTSMLVATDESSNERHCVRLAHTLSAADHAALTILSVHRPPSAAGHQAGDVLSSHDRRPPHLADELTHFCRWLGADAANGQGRRPEVAVAFGVPGIEIARLAAARHASLVVLGRQQRAPDYPIALGETADAVVRRSDRPTLFAPSFVTGVRSIVVAVDGSDRTLPVLDRTLDFACRWDADVTVLAVEPDLDDEHGPAHAPRTRTEHLRSHLQRWHCEHRPAARRPALIVRRGNPIHEVLAFAAATRPDVLAIGYRRGGQPKVIGSADIARNLLFSSPTAVLTIPI
jgi:nucleotide-binding universal stress UspA family protein